MKNRITLFFPAHVAPESDTFMIEYGGQMTVAAIGLEPGDYIEFQMVNILGTDPDRCECPPGRVELPSVAGFALLKCCGENIQVTADNPVVILDNPQRVFLRAVLYAADTSGIYAWAIDSSTSNVNDRLRGCPCPEA